MNISFEHNLSKIELNCIKVSSQVAQLQLVIAVPCQMENQEMLNWTLEQAITHLSTAAIQHLEHSSTPMDQST